MFISFCTCATLHFMPATVADHAPVTYRWPDPTFKPTRPETGDYFFSLGCKYDRCLGLDRLNQEQRFCVEDGEQLVGVSTGWSRRAVTRRWEASRWAEDSVGFTLGPAARCFPAEVCTTDVSCQLTYALNVKILFCRLKTTIYNQC